MLLLLVISVITVYGIVKLISFCKCCGQDISVSSVGYEEEWFGKGPTPSKATENSDEDSSIHAFKVHVPDEVLTDLKHRLENARFEESFKDSNFKYGFHTDYLREIVNYWKKQYQWREQEEYLNKYPHFKTRIEGIGVHFIHIKPTVMEKNNKKVFPILILHGWTGSFFEFYKMIPLLLSENKNQNFVFEIVCPSIPGYGFSEAPHQKGFNQRAAARMFVTLMNRLGYSDFYIQGGDWGAVIANLMAKFYPSKILGVHSNFFIQKLDTWNLIKYIAVNFFPFLVAQEEFSVAFPLKKKLKFLLQETGYLHIQATKPDTIGCALADSPVGLAAYLLEKFSTGTDPENRELPDGGLTKKFHLDELLTNVMIYWVNNNITSSMRFYKECFLDKYWNSYDRLPITVPCGIALFPNEFLGLPKILISRKLVKKLVSYSIMPRGGHFAAMEEPTLLAADIVKFVELTERKFR